MNYIAYLVTNTKNNKKYVGITTQVLKRRWRKHCREALVSAATAIQRAIIKYGESAFTVEHIASAHDWESLTAIECALIEQYASFFPTGYNLTKGGDGCLGLRHTVSSRARIGAASRGKKLSVEVLEKLRAYHAKRPAEHNRNISAGKKGKPCSEKRRKALSEARLREIALHGARKDSSETRTKKSENMKRWFVEQKALGRPIAFCHGHKHSEESKAKMRAIKLGKTASLETRMRMSVAHRRRSSEKQQLQMAH